MELYLLHCCNLDSGLLISQAHPWDQKRLLHIHISVDVENLHKKILESTLNLEKFTFFLFSSTYTTNNRRRETNDFKKQTFKERSESFFQTEISVRNLILMIWRIFPGLSVYMVFIFRVWSWCRLRLDWVNSDKRRAITNQVLKIRALSTSEYRRSQSSLILFCFPVASFSELPDGKSAFRTKIRMGDWGLVFWIDKVKVEDFQQELSGEEKCCLIFIW